MTTVHLHLKNLPPAAVNLDIRRFFIDFDIPEGGVEIVGGPEGEAFVTFNNYEDLLKATIYGKRPFMGRQLVLNLVNNFEIEKIIATINCKLAANITPQARPITPPRWMSPPRGMSPRRELPHTWSRSPVRDLSPPREMPRIAGTLVDLPWPKRPRPVTPPWSCEDSIFTGLESKRMRLSDQGNDDRRYLSSRAAASTDRDLVSSQERDTLRIELEKERQRNQDIEDELKRNRERIQRLERGIVEKDIDTMVRNRPVLEQPRSQKMDPRDEWDRRHPEEPRYQREEIRMQPEVYQDIPRRPIEDPPRYDRIDRFDRPEPRFDSPEPRFDSPEPRFDRPERRFEQSPPVAGYGGGEEMYGRDDTRYRGPGIDARRRERSPFRNQSQRRRDDGKQGRRATSPKRRQSPHQKDGPHFMVPFTGGVKQALFFIGMRFLPDNATACSVWEEFGGSLGRSLGVLMLVEKGDKPAKYWYVAFESYDERNAEIPLHQNTMAFEDKAVYRKLANIRGESKLFKSTRTGEDVEVTVKDQAILKQRFLLKGGKPLVWKGNEQLALNTISRSLFQPKKESNDGEIMVHNQSQSCWLRLICLPADTSACEVRSWFKSSQRVILVSKPDDKLGTFKAAYVAFDNPGSRNEEVHNCSESKKLTEKAALRAIAQYTFLSDSEIKTSTDEGVDEVMTEKEMKAIQKKCFPDDSNDRGTENKQRSLPSVTSEQPPKAEKDPLHYLQIKKIKPEMSCSKVWKWFGGRQGPAEGVTLLETEGSFIAFVAFRDPEKLREAMETNGNSETISEGKMLRKLACSNPDHMIFRSSVKGPNGMMSKEEKADLKTNFFFTHVKMVKKSDSTSMEQNASGPSEPEKSESLNKKDPKETGHLKPAGNAEMDQGVQKVFLKLVSLSEDVTACEVWSWFGGPTGSSPGVTVVQRCKEEGGVKEAFVEFKDWQSRNETKLKNRNATEWEYKNAKNCNERHALCTIALSEPEIEILQSTESGVDHSLTVEERDIIRNKMFPDGLPSYTNPKPQSKTPIQGLTKDKRPKLLQWKEKYEYLRLSDLKPAITAFTLKAQYRPCQGVTLVKNAFGQAVLAFVAFNKNTNGKATTWQNSRDRELASLGLDFDIYENTMKLNDRKITASERQQLIDHVQYLNSQEQKRKQGQVY